MKIFYCSFFIFLIIRSKSFIDEKCIFKVPCLFSLILVLTLVSKYDINGLIGNTTLIENISSKDNHLLKITDILGRETPYKKNTPLFYIYDDGTVEKIITLEN